LILTIADGEVFNLLLTNSIFLKDDIEDQMGRELLKNAKNWKNR
jgi:hypothetical protein